MFILVSILSIWFILVFEFLKMIFVGPLVLFLLHYMNQNELLFKILMTKMIQNILT